VRRFAAGVAETIIVILAVVAFGLAVKPAAAECEWKWTCDGQNHCESVPICESKLDLVPIRPPSMKPIAPFSLEPMEREPLPPVGFKRCRQKQVRRDGEWAWEEVCR
jgi:hypothetical protein